MTIGGLMTDLGLKRQESKRRQLSETRKRQSKDNQAKQRKDNNATVALFRSDDR